MNEDTLLRRLDAFQQIAGAIEFNNLQFPLEPSEWTALKTTIGDALLRLEESQLIEALQVLNSDGLLAEIIDTVIQKASMDFLSHVIQYTDQFNTLIVKHIASKTDKDVSRRTYIRLIDA